MSIGFPENSVFNSGFLTLRQHFTEGGGLFNAFCGPVIVSTILPWNQLLHLTGVCTWTIHSTGKRSKQTLAIIKRYVHHISVQPIHEVVLIWGISHFIKLASSYCRHCTAAWGLARHSSKLTVCRSDKCAEKCLLCLSHKQERLSAS